MARKIHIVRHGQELGTLNVADAVELLRDGFLQKTDEFWIENYLERDALENFPNLAGPAGACGISFLKSVRERAVVAGKAIKKGTETIRSRISATREATVSSQIKALEDYLPRVREQVSGALAKTKQTTHTALKDDEFLLKLFGAVYDCLPKPICRFVTEKVFVEFCLKHRRKLLG